MIDETQRKQILALLQTPQWRAVEDLAEQMKRGILEEERQYNNEWEYLSHHLRKEGEVSGINKLIKELYKEAQHVE